MWIQYSTNETYILTSVIQFTQVLSSSKNNVQWKYKEVERA